VCFWIFPGLATFAPSLCCTDTCLSWCDRVLVFFFPANLCVSFFLYILVILIVFRTLPAVPDLCSPFVSPSPPRFALIILIVFFLCPNAYRLRRQTLLPMGATSTSLNFLSCVFLARHSFPTKDRKNYFSAYQLLLSFCFLLFPGIVPP